MESVLNFGKFTLSPTLVEEENLRVFIMRNTYSTWQVRQEIDDASRRLHQNSTCGAAENIGTAAKTNGIMHEPVRDDRPNAFSNNISFVLSCIQTVVDIPSQSRKIDVPPNMFLG
ncbi:hypothetical protein FXO37_27746 [Capsicum annuum]|nr:hypothetical protein FXO37_27746 [Capsicum annuum]